MRKISSPLEAICFEAGFVRAPFANSPRGGRAGCGNNAHPVWWLTHLSVVRRYLTGIAAGFPVVCKLTAR